MSPVAFIVGGSGQIGQALCRRLLADGWRVTAAQRNCESFPEALRSLGAATIVLDREEGGALARAVGGGVDALIDTVAYDAAHARQLLEIEADVGAFVIVSSASVYRDAKGRTLDEAAANGFPDFPVPLAEDQPTVAPGPETYSTRKVALEQALLQGARRPVTILRPGAIHGAGSRHPREWWFVKRILDGRRAVPLAFGGESRFHTSATTNIAELIRLALAKPATRVLNAADPEALTVAAIGEAIAAVHAHDWRLVPMEGPPVGQVGQNPWAIPRPIVLDMARAGALGYRPVARYEDAIDEACRSAQRAAREGVAFPKYLMAMFDYAAEDALLADRQ